jgi:hypothetical protein
MKKTKQNTIYKKILRRRISFLLQKEFSKEFVEVFLKEFKNTIFLVCFLLILFNV